MKNLSLRDQTGAVMVIELALLAVVIAVAGFVYLRVQNVKQTPNASVTSSKPTVANGRVDNAINAISEGAENESLAAGGEDQAASDSKDVSAAANGLGGSYNENSF